jgi:hypothetical protein
MTDADYNLDCLLRLRGELAEQIKKYPVQMAWIDKEIERLKPEGISLIPVWAWNWQHPDRRSK